MDADLQYWLRIAEPDVTSAEALHRAGQELHACFFLQQAVEKTLKALLVRETHSVPPRIHNLQKLAGLCGLDLTSDQTELLEDLNGLYLESRYPETRDAAELEAAADQAERLIGDAKEFIKWLRLRI